MAPKTVFVTMLFSLFLSIPLTLAADTQRLSGRDILNMHNYYRCLHGTQPLVWDNGLAASAQEWAYNRQAAGCVMTHSGYAKLGENVAAGTFRGLTGYNYWTSDDAVVNGWYHEPFTYGSSAPTLNHFTQIVWHGSTRLGCAWASCQNSTAGEFWVCQFTPQGNYNTATLVNSNVPTPCRTRAQCEYILQGVDLTVKFGSTALANTALTANQITPATYNYAAQTCLTPISAYTAATNPFCVTDSTVLPKTLDVTVQNAASTGVALSVVMNCPSGQSLSGTGLVTCSSNSVWNIAGSCGGVPVTAAPNPPSAPVTAAPTPKPVTPATPAPPAASGCWGTVLTGVYLSGYAPGWTYVAGLTQPQAKAACLTLSGCKGLTQTTSGWELRAGSSPLTSGSGEKSVLRVACTTSPTAAPVGGKCFGNLLANTYLYLYPSGYTPPTTATLAEAKTACGKYSDCGGLTYTSGRWEVRKGNVPMTSGSGEQSYLVVSCAVAAESASSVTANAPWLIPVVAVIGVLIIIIAVVLLKKKKRDDRIRAYSGDFNPEVVSMKGEKVEETGLTPERELPPPLETSNLQTQPSYSQVPMSPTNVESPKIAGLPTASFPLSPSAAEPTETQSLFPQASPEVPMSPEAPIEPSRSSEWQKQTDATTGQCYYYNQKSGVTQWEVPDGL